jgi:hypothetical protein
MKLLIHFIFFNWSPPHPPPPAPVKAKRILNTKCKLSREEQQLLKDKQLMLQMLPPPSPPAISVMNFLRQARASCHQKNSSCFRISCCLSSGKSGTTSNRNIITAVFPYQLKWISGGLYDCWLEEFVFFKIDLFSRLGSAIKKDDSDPLFL